MSPPPPSSAMGVPPNPISPNLMFAQLPMVPNLLNSVNGVFANNGANSMSSNISNNNGNNNSSSGNNPDGRIKPNPPPLTPKEKVQVLK